MNKTFDDWWDSDKPETQDNPYRPDSAAYWAYAGWVSGRDAMLQEVLSIVNGRAAIELERHFEVK